MKTARVADGGSVEASADAPSQAICPNCGGDVVLRHRKRMNHDVTYYWRHLDNKNHNCSARNRIKPFKRTEGLSK